MTKEAASRERGNDERQRHATLTDRCHRLVRFLRELALSQSPRVTTVDEHPVVVWLDDLPAGLSLLEQAGPGEVVLAAPAAAALPPPPALPDVLTGWVVMPEPGEPPEEFPPLREIGLRPRLEDRTDGISRSDGIHRSGDDTIRLVDAPQVAAAYERWLPAWRIWAARVRADAERRALHNVLHTMAQRLVQEGDALELVLCTGLLSWSATGSEPATADQHDGSQAGAATTAIRHHLLSTKLLVEVDAVTSAIRLRLPADAATRLEDTHILHGVRAFRPERTNALHERLRGRPAVPLGSEDERILREWLTFAVDTPTDGYSPSWRRDTDLGPRPRLTFAPALVLRARGRAALLNYYDQMLAALGGDTWPPLGLVQLVETLEADERLAWLAADRLGSAGRAEFGTDPLFPLPANPEQARVMEGLRRDSGVVVEGPPGTGKTHTIANLTCALLAQGRRVLVTSQKAQALRVLRDKMPPALQQLCVSLTDTDDTGSADLATSISALAAEKAVYDPAAHDRRIARLRARRDSAAARHADLAEQVQRGRAAEGVRHEDVAPGWSGTLAQIARRVREERRVHGWIPLPVPASVPLDAAEALELLAGLRVQTPTRARRASQTLPDRAVITPVLPIRELVAAERAAADLARAGGAELSRAASGLVQRLDGLSPAQVDSLYAATSDLLAALDAIAGPQRRWEWVDRALQDALAGRDTVLWAKVASVSPAVAEASEALDHVGLRTVVLPPLAGQGSASLPQLRADGQTLREHLAAGGGLRGMFRPKAQRAARLLLTGATVDGLAPRTLDLLDAVLASLTARIALETASQTWALVGVRVDAEAAPEVRLARLHDLAEALAAVQRARDARDHAIDVTSSAGVTDVTVGDVPTCRDLAATADALRLRRRAQEATADLSRIHDGYATAAQQTDSPPELTALAGALADRDVDAYAAALAALEAAYAEKAAQLRCDELLKRVRAVHPELASVLTASIPPGSTSLESADAAAWERRFDSFAQAWSWACAATWLAHARQASGEPDVEAELDAAQDALAATTGELAGALAWKQCLERMGAEQSAALRAYADAAAGKFTGRYAGRYRQAAREAMRVAQTAVPAWVMPIGEVLSTVPAVRNSFDVVIVDEGSQAGLDSLFLLWLAPRVIVVGDDRQCTPAESTPDQVEPVLRRLDTLLWDVPAWLRVAFTPGSSLFALLRTRFGEVVRLREHFRCMPEIIEWSSAMFYRDAPLVPLRQFGADRLPPLRSRYVPDAATSGASTGLRNPAEAEVLVSELVACAQNPDYEGRSFGVVVLQGTAQADLIRSKLIACMSPAEQQMRRLRVGTPPDFQGDERDVVFLSMVVAPDTPSPSLTRLEYQRRFNVAASRARDQVWLFHSVTEDDLEPSDLRHSYLSYIRSVAAGTGAAQAGLLPAHAPDLTGVRPDIAHPSFDTLFEQRVFRALRERGFLVWPQGEVNGKRIDLMVAGGRARLAVECDSDTPAGPEQIAHEFARERELRRAGWRFWRIRQSEFESDPDAALRPLWGVLAAAGVTAVSAPVVPGPQRPGPQADPPTPVHAPGQAAPGPGGRDVFSGQAGGTQPTTATGTGPGATAAGGSDIPDQAVTAESMVKPSAGGHHRWKPIPLSDLEGLDDAISEQNTRHGQASAPATA